MQVNVFFKGGGVVFLVLVVDGVGVVEGEILVNVVTGEVFGFG